MTSNDLNNQIEAYVERANVVSKLIALFVVWEEAVVGVTDNLAWAKIRDAGDAYVGALAAFIDSRAQAAVLSLREPSSVVAPPFAPTEKGTIDLVEMTERLGLPGEEQTAVQAFSGEDYGHMWTEAEAEELIEAWNAAARDSAS